MLQVGSYPMITHTALLIQLMAVDEVSYSFLNNSAVGHNSCGQEDYIVLTGTIICTVIFLSCCRPEVLRCQCCLCCLHRSREDQAAKMVEHPRPRPRPRPIQKSSTTSATLSSPSITKTTPFEAGSSSTTRSNATTIPLSSPNGAAKRVIMVEDTDEMFMRNRNRSSKTWQKLEKLDRSELFRLGCKNHGSRTSHRD